MENIMLGEQWVEVSLYQLYTCSLIRRHAATFSKLCTKSEAVSTTMFTWYYKTFICFYIKLLDVSTTEGHFHSSLMMIMVTWRLKHVAFLLSLAGCTMFSHLPAPI
jgi:uncharacterized membrane protein